jgi:ATP-dependent Clp protease, protease subunit
VTHNVGNVDSIGNAVFLAGEERYACPHSTFMFHGVAAAFQPAISQLDAKQLRERLDAIDADELRIGSIIEQRTKLDHAEIVALFREQRTKDAAHAISAGIVDEIKDVQIPPGSPVIALVFKR